MTIAYDPIVKDVGAASLTESAKDSKGDSRSPTNQKQSTPGPVLDTTSTNRAPRETGDEVNRFLLCVLVSKSAKYIKQKAQDSGEYLQTTTIVRGVLKSYRVAAKENPGLLSGSTLHLSGLRKLNRRVLKEQINSSVRERVRDSQARLARATRLGDETRIKSAKDELARDVADRDRLAGEFA
jgi:hypothetical protein